MNYDKIFLTRAIELAKRGRFRTSPNPNVGCVIVKNGNIIGEGYHKYVGGPHAEIYALKMAGVAAHGATVYTTLEPCNYYGRTPPCTKALIDSGVKRVIAAMLDPNPKVSGTGLKDLKEAGIEVHSNLMKSESEKINHGFIKRMREGRPWIKLKLATSLDGRTATYIGESKWITSIESRNDIHNGRAESDVILSTANTVLADNPYLNVRWKCLSKAVKEIYPIDKLHQPIRVIVDSTNRVTPNHLIANKSSITLLARILIDNLLWPDYVEQIILPTNTNKLGYPQIDLMSLMVYLGKRQINNVWVEAGANFAGALLDYKLVDELILYQSPKLLGSNARPLCNFKNTKSLNTSLKFNLFECKQIGPDIRLRLTPINNS